MASLSIKTPAAAARTTKITQLNELNGKSTQDFVKLFIHNIAFIDSQEKMMVRQVLERKRATTLQSLRSALQGKVASITPTHSILKKEFLNDLPNLYNDIMELSPLSYISSESVTPTTEEVKILDASVATNSGCSKCGMTDSPSRVAELEQKVATLEEELATYKQILALAAGSPSCGDACLSSNTALLEQKIAALDQRCSVIEQWAIPSLSHKESELSKLLKPMLTPTLSPKHPLMTGDGKAKLSIETPPKITPPVAAPRTRSLPSPAQNLPSTPSVYNGQLPKVSHNVKKTYLYIGNCEPSFTRDLLKTHINSSTGSNLVLSDIVELNTKNKGKAFKVSVPENKKKLVLSIWQTGIKAEPYRIHKSARVTEHQGKKRVHRNSFQGPKPHTSNKSRYSPKNRWENQHHQNRPRPQQTSRKSQNQPHRRDPYQMGDNQDWRPYQYDNYQEQNPY